MTFWDAMGNVWSWCEVRFTRGLGVAGGTITVLLGSGIISPKEVVYYLTALNILTYWRGEATGTTYQVAKAVVATTKTVTAEAPPPTTPAAAAILTASQPVPAPVPDPPVATATPQPTADEVAEALYKKMVQAQERAKARAAAIPASTTLKTPAPGGAVP